MSVVGLYAGVAGLELGFKEAGFKTLLLADKDEHCQQLLTARFPNTTVVGDVANLSRFPEGTTIVTAGFPCQNLSMAGNKEGITGQKSGDIRHLFELLGTDVRPTLVIENVYFMLHLKKGAAMNSLVGDLEALGYRWGYRVVNTMAFGLPQRRRRVLLVASTSLDPRDILFADEAGLPMSGPVTLDRPVGFYWTEGRSGVGTTADGIPPLKIASTLGIPSAPAVLFPDGEVLKPGIEACERLQGFPVGWTDLDYGVRRSPRWSMVGNAVSVPTASWLAHSLKAPRPMLDFVTQPLVDGAPWPTAAYGDDHGRFAVEASEYPVRHPVISIEEFRDSSWIPLSARALRGFILRAKEGGLRFPGGFLPALERALAKAERREERRSDTSH
ncbi:DNA (cytosine-5-)-methyltransferase [Mesorhizobium sp. M1163]|uniref:DNA cytosine methyltransferase n=1 Tax=Mesorhizobium sp. M1163 TaxID=2957065 RepID=UPI00333D5E72